MLRNEKMASLKEAIRTLRARVDLLLPRKGEETRRMTGSERPLNPKERSARFIPREIGGPSQQ